MNKLFENPIYVTSPLIPNMEDIHSQLGDVLNSKWLTNQGSKHNELEGKLKDTLKVPNTSLFNNGTIALLTALKVFDFPQGSEIITTPFTFAATPHCISWNGLTPVFCDIEKDTMTIDATKIEALITPKTKAILGVHVYGFPCDVKKIDAIAKKHNLKVIYDAAHAFTTEIEGQGIGNFGDITMFSFHATKLFNTIEGGCLTYNNDELKEKIYYLRNFGIKNEEEVIDIGINGKMNEVQASFGLLNLKIFEEEQQKRAQLKSLYNKNLSQIKGITIPQSTNIARDSYQYYPIIIEDDFGISRDDLYKKLKEYNVFTRKYFYPICSDYKCYQDLPSSKKENLPLSNEFAQKVLCLPFYGALKIEDAEKICELIKFIQQAN